MSDSINVLPSTSPQAVPVATDTVGGRRQQIVKLGVGPAGQSRLVEDADGLPVKAADLGAQADAPAADDTGSFSLISLVKRGLANWAMLLARIPAPIGGRVPVEAMGPDADGGAVSGNPVPMAGWDGVFARRLRTDLEGRMFTAAPEVSGAISAVNETVELDVRGLSGVAIDVRGTFTGTLLFQATINGSVWFNVTSVIAGTSANQASASNATAPGNWTALCAGFSRFRVSANSFTPGGQAAVTLRGAIEAPYAFVASIAGFTANASLLAGTNLVGDVGIQVRANATGAASIHHFVAVAGVNSANIKNAAGRVLGWSLANTTASWRFVKLHNTAGAPTAGAGVVLTIAIPPNGVAQQAVPSGMAFTTGIGRTCVTGAPDNDNGPVAASDVVGDIFFA